MSSTATLVYGLSVDPFKLLYQARAWSDNHVQLAYIDGMISGQLQQDTSRNTALPTEILSLIKQNFWDTALKDNLVPAKLGLSWATDIMRHTDPSAARRLCRPS